MDLSGEVARTDPTPDTRGIGFDGTVNFWLLGAVVGLVLLSGFWKSSVVFNVYGTDVGLPGVVRDIGIDVVGVPPDELPGWISMNRSPVRFRYLTASRVVDVTG